MKIHSSKCCRTLCAKNIYNMDKESSEASLSLRTKQIVGGLFFFALFLIPYVFNFESTTMENSEEVLGT